MPEIRDYGRVLPVQLSQPVPCDLVWRAFPLHIPKNPGTPGAGPRSVSLGVSDERPRTASIQPAEASRCAAATAPMQGRPKVKAGKAAKPGKRGKRNPGAEA